jgi:dTDP-4-amino-4,6-dideoxygalactose transaminase
MIRAMRVPLLDLGEQYRILAEPIRTTIDEVLKSHRFILGPKVREFEESVAAFCGSPYAVGVSSGTDALLSILMALRIGRGDAVITPAFTFFATAACAVRLGATPHFVDIDPTSYNMSPEGLEAFLRSACQMTSRGLTVGRTGEVARAIIPVHLFGLCCDMKPILELGDEFSIPVIEDAAQAIGAEYPAGERVRSAGTMGTAGFFSFYPSKNLGAAGDAGLVVCRHAVLNANLRALREHGMGPRYYHSLVGGNFRLDEIQAAILGVKLPHLKKWAAARRQAADFYREEFGRHGLTQHVALPAEPYRDAVTEHHVYHQFVIRTSQRDALRRYLTENEVGTEIYYPLGLHRQVCFRDLNCAEATLPETDRAALETLALPMYAEISRDAQRYVVDVVARFFFKR